MKLTREQVEHVAKLARLKLSEDELKRYTTQLSDILGYVEQLNKLDTKGIEPTSHAVEVPTPFREDEPKPCLSPEEALANAPERHGDYVKVPRVIEE